MPTIGTQIVLNRHQGPVRVIRDRAGPRPRPTESRHPPSAFMSARASSHAGGDGADDASSAPDSCAGPGSATSRRAPGGSRRAGRRSSEKESASPRMGPAAARFAPPAGAAVARSASRAAACRGSAQAPERQRQKCRAGPREAAQAQSTASSGKLLCPLLNRDRPPMCRRQLSERIRSCGAAFSCVQPGMAGP